MSEINLSLASKICIPCAADNVDNFLEEINLIQTNQDIKYIEIRLDSLNFHDLNNSNIKKIFANINPNIKTIATCRQKQYGGHFRNDTLAQQQILQYANDLGCNYIDIDYPIYNQIKINNLNAKKIISYHNFKNTPDNESLNKIKDDMLQTDADIIKIAVMSNNHNDAKSIYSLLVQEDSKPIITIGMGNYGKITRVVAPILGSYLTFAKIKNSKSKIDIPGIIEIDKLQLLYTQLKNI